VACPLLFPPVRCGQCDVLRPIVTSVLSGLCLPIDPGEYTNVAAQNPAIYKQMLARVDEVQLTVYSPDRGTDSDKAACNKSIADYSYYWGPFIE
jgi:hypothetical protein